jgi:hypothetical protein
MTLWAPKLEAASSCQPVQEIEGRPQGELLNNLFHLRGLIESVTVMWKSGFGIFCTSVHRYSVVPTATIDGTGGGDGDEGSVMTTVTLPTPFDAILVSLIMDGRTGKEPYG